ncbi:hypothetical protein C943_04335 [Mariniradius saccharolyticus AK6]|uniref:Glycosyl transferase family 1 domain-containing protein n=1 Tax=Mariniradius saccharolyticus AK6 TaxID=1239962 RepID=M7XY98_9BACT|nr:hypothetical protein C943_04335 [Mariniradius saccharolyticus AK6]
MTETHQKSIILISNTLLKGGAEKQCVLLANFLSQHFRVNLLIFNNQIDPQLFSQLNRAKIEIKILEGNLVQKLLAIRNFVRYSRPSVAISFLLTSNIIGGVFGKLLGIQNRFMGIRTNEIHGWKWYAQLVIHRFFATKTVFNNYSGANSFWQRGFYKQKSVVIQNGIKAPDLRKDYSNDSIGLKILTVARFVKEKDLLTAIEAVSITRNRWPQHKITYFIVGYGEQENLIKLKIKELGLGEVVNIVVNPDDLQSYFLDADLYLSTSINEGMPNTILEAMSYGLPIIATDVGDVSELVTTGSNGFVVMKRNIDGIVESISYFLREPSHLEKMGSRSRKIVESSFTVEKMGLAYKDIIESN